MSHYTCRKCDQRYDECICGVDQSTPKNENNYYETKIGDAIDEPPPVNPIPDRKDELSGDQIDIEEYIAMVDEAEHDFDQGTNEETETVFPDPQGAHEPAEDFVEGGDKGSTQSNELIWNADLERRERLEGAEETEEENSNE